MKNKEELIEEFNTLQKQITHFEDSISEYERSIKDSEILIDYFEKAIRFKNDIIHHFYTISISNHQRAIEKNKKIVKMDYDVVIAKVNKANKIRNILQKQF